LVRKTSDGHIGTPSRMVEGEDEDLMHSHSMGTNFLFEQTARALIPQADVSLPIRNPYMPQI